MEFKRIAVLISGSGSNLQALIDKEKEGLFKGKIKLVISNRKNAYGLVRAEKNSIKNYNISVKDYPEQEAYDKHLLSLLREEKIDLIVLAGYLKYVSPIIIKDFENKIINIHPSLLPAFGGEGFYGLKVHEAVIERGCKISGATVHFVNEKHDDGPIILQKALYIDDRWKVEDLQKQVLKIEHEILPLAVKYYCEDRLTIDNKKVFIKER